MSTTSPAVPLPSGGPLRGSSVHVDRRTTHWAVEGEYLEVDGRLTLFGITLRTYELDGGEARSLNGDWRPITTEAMRALAIGQIEADNRDNIEFPEPTWDDGAVYDDDPPAVWDAVAHYRRLRDRPGSRARYDDEHWRAVAAVYRDAYANGKHPAAEVAAAFNVAKATARSWVRRCRELDLLPSTKERKPRA